MKEKAILIDKILTHSRAYEQHQLLAAQHKAKMTNYRLQLQSIQVEEDKQLISSLLEMRSTKKKKPQRVESKQLSTDILIKALKGISKDKLNELLAQIGEQP